MTLPISSMSDALKVEGPISFRLHHHRRELPSGKTASFWEGGTGPPLFFSHGFAADSEVYLPNLNRLTEWFHVVAMDTPGHGQTSSLPWRQAFRLSAYTQAQLELVDYLGIQRCFLVGHSFGGRLVAELAKARPRLPIAVVVIDAIVGEPWDELMEFSFSSPLKMVNLTQKLFMDTLSIRQFGWRRVMKMARVGRHLMLDNILRPDRRAAVALAIAFSPKSAQTLDNLRDLGVPGMVLHGDSDDGVPIEVGTDAATRAGWQLRVIEQATHSWLLNDPASCQRVFQICMDPGGHLAHHMAHTLAELGLDPNAPLAVVEQAMTTPEAELLKFKPTKALNRHGVAGPIRYQSHV